jgi:hypothetical protein
LRVHHPWRRVRPDRHHARDHLGGTLNIGRLVYIGRSTHIAPADVVHTRRPGDAGADDHGVVAALDVRASGAGDA